MLAKQAWRVAMNPDSLLHCIFQHKYFSGSSFLAVDRGQSPSFTWRSLLYSRDLLVASLRWQIGDGESASIVGVPWLPRPISFQIICKLKSLPEDTKVAALLDEAGWKEPLVRDEFLQIDAYCILSIRLPNTRSPDELIWHHGKKGKFTVKSAYQLACMLGTPASPSSRDGDWRLAWDLQLAPKIKLFIWKVYSNALPTMTNLRNRGLRLEGGCPLCDAMEEDIMHVLVRCSFARLIWAVSGVPWKLVESHTEDVMVWLRAIHQRADREELEMIAVIYWSLWYHRNMRIFEGKELQAVEVVDMAKRQLVRKKIVLAEGPG
ncbi:UNVERIFIED_CONTAM: hypothetical protein Slati_1466900 [Sesamum latifolium]|uniref:Reverse transcriptase zinc-binding domain-containing protein n=1 Tax=Sesamum latifolium TaxID=2727402 RepID=A0AAW2X6K7_9LAMI